MLTGTTNADSEELRSYLREVCNYPLLTAEEEVQLATEYAAGHRAARRLAAPVTFVPKQEAYLHDVVERGEQARQRLIQSNLRLVVSVARRYQGRGLSLPDLIQEGNIGLQIGIDKFDPRKGFRLSTYVYWWIKQAIIRALANSGRLIRLPVNAGDLMRRASLAEQQLTASLERPATLEEVAAAVHSEPSRLLELRQVGRAPASLDVPIGDDSELTRADLIADDDAQHVIETTVEHDELSDRMTEVLAALPAREREVLQLHYGINHPRPLTLSQIGRQLGVTRERARQIEGQALRRLRDDPRTIRALAELATA
jgi:RNA polymerase primary sigma factor